MLLQNREWRRFSAPASFAHDRVAQRFSALFGQIEWKADATADNVSHQRGHLGHGCNAYMKAFLVMLEEQCRGSKQLRQYLVEHPALVWVIGFRLVPSKRANSHGFDVERSVPSARHLRRMLQTLDLEAVNGLLQASVRTAQQMAPELGEIVSVDVQHIYAVAAQNNPNAYVSHRYDPACQPKGDPNCRLGIKKRANQTRQGEAAMGKDELLWGYGTGIAVSQTATHHAFVLADWTQPFNENDVTYGKPLLLQARQVLGTQPLHLTGDAAFDAWYMYELCAADGIAAIPLNQRGKPAFHVNAHDHWLCPVCLHPMTLIRHWYETQGKAKTERVHKARVFCSRCQGQHKVTFEPGGIKRLKTDRQSAAYRTIYKERTASERINSLARWYQIQRPQQRRLTSIAARNRLIYLLINLRALQRVQLDSLETPFTLKAA